MQPRIRSTGVLDISCAPQELTQTINWTKDAHRVKLTLKKEQVRGQYEVLLISKELLIVEI